MGIGTDNEQKQFKRQKFTISEQARLGIKE